MQQEKERERERERERGDFFFERMAFKRRVPGCWFYVENCIFSGTFAVI